MSGNEQPDATCHLAMRVLAAVSPKSSLLRVNRTQRHVSGTHASVLVQSESVCVCVCGLRFIFKALSQHQVTLSTVFN